MGKSVILILSSASRSRVSGVRSLLQATPSVAAVPSRHQLLGQALAASSAQQPPCSKQSVTSCPLTYSVTRSNVYSASNTWRSFQDPDALDFARKVSGG